MLENELIQKRKNVVDICVKTLSKTLINTCQMRRVLDLIYGIITCSKVKNDRIEPSE